MVPIEIGTNLLKRKSYEREGNHVLQRRKSDLLEEKRDVAQLQIVAYRRRRIRYFNSKVRQQRV